MSTVGTNPIPNPKTQQQSYVEGWLIRKEEINKAIVEEIERLESVVSAIVGDDPEQVMGLPEDPEQRGIPAILERDLNSSIIWHTRLKNLRMCLKRFA
jgi:hypothetical protein